MDQHYDLIVIGSGPAGRRAAIQAAKLGRSVLVVENRLRVGGVSVHTGTIPSKTLRETVLNLSGWRERGFYGLAYRVKKDIEGKDLGARLRMMNWRGDDTPELVARVVARAFEGLIIQAGRARYVFSWSELAKLRDRDGAEVYLTGLVRSAVDDPRQVNALHEELTRWGITPASAPGAAPLPG